MTTDSPLAVIFNQVFHQIFELQFPVQAEIFAPFTFFDVFAAMPPWQSWSQSSWNNWRDDKNKYQYDNEEALQFPEVETPNSWKSTNTFYDENVSFGLQFHRTIQPTSSSRKRGLTGLDPLKVPIGLLTRHGASEFGLRTLSNGRFFWHHQLQECSRNSFW